MSAKSQALLVAGLFFAFYAFHCAPGVTVEDSGDFLLGAMTLGTIHPPGYPLYTLIAFLAARLPLIPSALAINLLSGIFTAGSAGLLYLLLNRTLQVPRAVALIAVTALGLHPLIWSQAGVAEVYALNLFLVIGALYLAFEYRATRYPVWWSFLWLVLGLGLSNHYPLFILAGLGFSTYVLRPGIHKPPRRWGPALACFVLGLTPYLLLVINALWITPSYNFGKLSTLDMVWDHILRFHYRGIDQAGGVFIDKLLLFFRAELAVLGGFVALAPFVLLGIWRFKVEAREWRWPLAISTLTTSLGLALLLGFPADERHQAIFNAYLGPAVLFHAIYLAAGVHWALDRINTRALARAGALGLFALCLALQFAFARPHSSHRGDEFAAKWGRATLNSLALNSALVLCGTDVFVLYYLHHIEGVRPDLTLYDRFSIFTKENLYAPQLMFHSRDPFALREEVERKLAVNAKRNVYYLCPEPPKEMNIPVVAELYAFRVRGAGPYWEPKIEMPDRELLELAVFGNPEREYWLDKRRTVFLHQTLSYAAQSAPGLIPQILDWIARSRYFLDYEFSLAFAKALVDHKRHGESLDLLKRREKLVGRDDLHPEELSLFCGLELAAGQHQRAEELCLHAVNKSCLAPAHVNLALIYRSRGQQSAMREQAQAALRCNPQDQTALRLLSQ